MDASYLLAAVLCGVPAFLGARAVRQFRWDTETRGRARAVLARAAAYHRHTGTNTGPNTGTGTGDDDGDDDGHGNQSLVRETGRRAIRGDHVGPRLGRYAAGRNSRGANETAVA